MTQVPNSRELSTAPIKAKNGMVVSPEPLAADVGLELLKQGGNAIDAAVGVGFALAVTLPTAGNIGGSGFMVLRTADGQKVAVDYREVAPGRSTADMYINSDGTYKDDVSRRVPDSEYEIRQANRAGYLAAGVPGTVSGLCVALDKCGSLPLKEVMAPAIKLAEDGFVIDHYMAPLLQSYVQAFSAFPTTREIFTQEGQAYQEGERLVQADLARTLKLIADQGPDGFYRGETARLIAADMARNGGLITEDDLANYSCQIREPIQGTYRGFEVVSMPPPSSGGVAIVEMLNILEGFDLSSSGHNSSETLHLLIESMRRAYADRAQHLGDSDFVDVPVDHLISKAYAAKLRSSIDPLVATDSIALGPQLTPRGESGETTHYSVADKEGNIVSNTYSLAQFFGAKVVAAGTGVLLNNEMGDFNARPGITDETGSIGTAPNLIEPNKRMLSSMSPTLILKDDKPFLAVGSPGGNTIINVVLQVILNVIDHEMNIKQAVEVPRIHHSWFPNQIKMESDSFADEVRKALEGKGHSLEVGGTLGNVQAVMVDLDDGYLYGASDHRRSGKAIGF